MSVVRKSEPEDPHEESLGRLLLRAHRLYADRALTRLHARGHADLGIAHVTLLPHFDPEGTRTSVLGERAGVTKQAAGQLVADLERAGYVERVADEGDRRAVRVTFTRRGQRLVADAASVKEEVDEELARAIGVRGGLEQLRELLTAMLAGRGLDETKSRR
jgi:DNA-binding MarR family transcriptional regulator